MAYMEKKWVSHNGQYIIEDKYHSLKAMPKNPLIRERRKPRTGMMTEKQRIINVRHQADNLTRLLMDNFKVGDWYLTFKLAKLVPYKKIKAEYAKMMRKLRAYWKSHNKELKYIAVLENMTGKGRPHGHIIIPGDFPFSEIKKLMAKAWALGDTYAKPYGGEAMDARRLSSYFVKEDMVEKAAREGKDESDDDLLGQRGRVMPSTNLIRTKPVRKKVKKSETYREKIIPPQGYRIVKPLTHTGWNQDGYPWQHAVFERCNT